MEVPCRRVKIGENEYDYFFMNKLQKISSDKSSDNENAVKHVQNVDNSVETAYKDSRNDEGSEEVEEEENDNALRSLKCQLCRMCGKKQSVLIPIFKTCLADEVSISRKIELHLRLKIRINDGLPPNICLTCNSMLQAWHTLYDSCIAADAVLRRKFRVASDSMIVYSQENCDERSDEYSSSCQLMDEHSLQPEEEYRSLSPSEIQINSEEQCVNKQISCNKKISSKPSDNLLIYHYKVKCCYCSENVEEINLKEHKMLCQLKKSVCEVCGISIQRRHMKTHISKVHKETQLCEKCGKLFSCLDFKTHKGECTRQPNVCCEFCFRVFFSDQGYKNHMNEHARGVTNCLGVKIKASSLDEVSPSYNCPVCGDNFPNKLSVVVHLNASKLITCEPCNEDFRNERAFLVHVCSSRNKFWHCRYCFQTFEKKCSWQIHERTHSSEDRTFDCKMCEKKYPSLESLMQHALSHGPNNYHCTYCDKKFNSQSQLKEHLMQHEGYIYKCKTCGKLFQSIQYLQIHFKNTHKETEFQKNKGSFLGQFLLKN